MDSPKLVVASICASRPEADLAKGELESAGIPAMVQADTAGGMREHLAWSGAGFKILVREEDLVAARDLLTPSPDSQLKEGEEIPEDEHQDDLGT
jgi:F420-dependent methylenetetrahydromethanopterin dehydrogenase